jgi:hypothetical protein
MRSNARICYIGFIPARPRLLDFSQTLSLLISGLMLSIRFRQRVLPMISDLEASIDKLTPEQRPSRRETLGRLERVIYAIETEVKEMGLNIPEDPVKEPPILSAFRDGPSKDRLRKEIAIWTNDRNNLIRDIRDARQPEGDWVVPTETALIALRKVKDVNPWCIEIIVKEILYVEGIQAVGG